jgi:peptidoglycan hydrolase-like protein with peptidoglycan-binding domain
MLNNRTTVLYSVLGFVAVAMTGSWMAASRIESPAEAAARTSPPVPSPILVPIEQRVLSTNVVTRGTARFGLPQPISIVPSALKSRPGLITTLPLPNAQIERGGVLLTASGRPVLVLQGAVPTYRDLSPGTSGEDVRQLEQGLARLGFEPGPIDGTYDQRTGEAVARWYGSAGFEPFGPTIEQLARLRVLETELGDAIKINLAAANAATAAGPAVESARATAEMNNQITAVELAARIADRSRLETAPNHGAPLALESERAKAQYANTAAEADVAATIAERAFVALDPRQPETARAAADARLALAKATALKTRLETQLAVQAAESEIQSTDKRLKLAQASVAAATRAGEMSVQTALDAKELAEFEARLAAERVERLDAELATYKRQIGIQVPVDEIVFLPSLPVRVHEVAAVAGDVANGRVMSVTDNQLAIDSALPLASAALIKAGMKVAIDEQTLGIRAAGVVKSVATSPGTRGVGGYNVYFEVGVLEASTPLAGFSVRLTIRIKSTEGLVTVVPLSALSLAADGASRVQVQRNGQLEYVTVEPGLSADGFVAVTSVGDTLAPGLLVVVGYDNPAQFISGDEHG